MHDETSVEGVKSCPILFHYLYSVYFELAYGNLPVEYCGKKPAC
jgi:hypothetical protein